MKLRAVAILVPPPRKSALALAVAEVRRRDHQLRLDRRLSRLRHRHRQDRRCGSARHPHLIDIVEPTEEYTAAQYARDAAATIRDVFSRGRLPILVGGTGFYFRALTRGLFPGPGADAALRARLEAIAARRDVTFLHRMLQRVDPESAQRIMPRDLMRLVRALEVYFLTGRPLTAHFAATTSLIPDVKVIEIGLRLPAAAISERVTRRVDQQFERGLLDEMRALLARGIPEDARPFGGLVYRQAMEHLHGVRDEAATR